MKIKVKHHHKPNNGRRVVYDDIFDIKEYERDKCDLYIKYTDVKGEHIFLRSPNNEVLKPTGLLWSDKLDRYSLSNIVGTEAANNIKDTENMKETIKKPKGEVDYYFDKSLSEFREKFTHLRCVDNEIYNVVKEPHLKVYLDSESFIVSIEEKMIYGPEVSELFRIDKLDDIYEISKTACKNLEYKTNFETLEIGRTDGISEESKFLFDLEEISLSSIANQVKIIMSENIFDFNKDFINSYCKLRTVFGRGSYIDETLNLDEDAYMTKDNKKKYSALEKTNTLLDALEQCKTKGLLNINDRLNRYNFYRKKIEIEASAYDNWANNLNI